MHTDSRPPATSPGYAAGPVTKAPDWHALVAWDLLFNNLTTGLARRPLAGRLSYQLGTPTGLCGAACPVRPDGARERGRHAPRRPRVAARAQRNSPWLVIREPPPGASADLHPQAALARRHAH